jgi:uncharacterized membrane protein HdeD (DUF308 family)
MTPKKIEVNNNFRDISQGRRYWGWFMTVGILLILLGALAVGYAGWATEFTVIFLGFLLAGAGLLQIISSFYTKKWTGFSHSLLLALFYIIAGGLCIFKPLQSAEGITLLIAALLLIGGSFRLFSALRNRFDYWGLIVLSGLISIGLGILILFEWPSSSFWVIGLFVGVDLILIGWSWILISIAAKR